MPRWTRSSLKLDSKGASTSSWNFSAKTQSFTATPLTLIDVGARGGLQRNWRDAEKHLRIIGFEPDPEEYARLANRKDPARTTCINAALHRAPGEQVLNVGHLGGTSSFLEPDWDFINRFPDPQRYEVVQRVPVKVETLDRALGEHGVHDPDFAKIDTQGAELAILEGAAAALRDALFGVELEILFGSLYVGQPGFGELDELLRAAGFQLMDLRPSYWKRARGARFGGPKGQLAFADAVYFKSERRFQQQLDGIAQLEARQSKLLRALSVCLLYGYVDYAIELFQPNRALFEPGLSAIIVRHLESAVTLRSRIPHFRGRGTLSHFFYRLHRLLYPTLDGWASGARHLGNLD